MFESVCSKECGVGEYKNYQVKASKLPCNECKKRPREKMGVMLAWVPKVQCYVRMAASAAGPVCPAGTRSFSSTRPRAR